MEEDMETTISRIFEDYRGIIARIQSFTPC